MLGQAGDRDFEQVDLLLPGQGQQDMQRPFEAIEVQHKGVGRFDILGRFGGRACEVQAALPRIVTKVAFLVRW